MTEKHAPGLPAPRPQNDRQSGPRQLPRPPGLSVPRAMPRRSGPLGSLWGYLGDLTNPRIVLWCYLLWWSFTVSRYFDPAPRLWLTSAGLSAIIGTGLYLSTAHGTKTITRLDRFQIARLYLMPFCVSSFAALIKDRGFFLVFHPTVHANVEGAGICTVFVAVALLARLTTRNRSI